MKKTTPSSVSVAAAALAFIILCSTNLLPRCAASTTVDALTTATTTTTTPFLAAASGGGGGYSGMADADDEFLMESGSSSHSLRMLQARSNNVYQTVKPNQPAYNCGRYQYHCLDKGQDRKLYCDPRKRGSTCK